MTYPLPDGAFDFSKFPGLWNALQDFSPIDMLTYIPDPWFKGVYLFKFEFNSNRAWGLFIWSNNTHKFIEEPAEIEDYGFKSIAQVYKKYPGLRSKYKS